MENMLGNTTQFSTQNIPKKALDVVYYTFLPNAQSGNYYVCELYEFFLSEYPSEEEGVA